MYEIIIFIIQQITLSSSSRQKLNLRSMIKKDNMINFSSQGKCYFCKVQLDKQQPKIIYDRQRENLTLQKNIICLWCCKMITFQQQQKLLSPSQHFKNANTNQTQQRTKNKFSLIQNILKSTCIICGLNCEDRIQLSGSGENTKVKFQLSKSCYFRLEENSFWSKRRSQYQKKIYKQIEKLCKTKCSYCKNQFNILKASKEQLEWYICENCLKKSKNGKLSIKEQQINHCSLCRQPEIFQKIGMKFIIIGSIGDKKKFDLIPATKNFDKNFDKNNQQVDYSCNFCFYQQYLKFEKTKTQICPQKAAELKIKYQKHFASHCIVCLKKISSCSNIFIIQNKFYKSILAYICKQCHTCCVIKKQRSYVCEEYLNKFLNKEGQCNQMQKKFFEKLVQQFFNKPIIQQMKKQQQTMKIKGITLCIPSGYQKDPTFINSERQECLSTCNNYDQGSKRSSEILQFIDLITINQFDKVQPKFNNDFDFQSLEQYPFISHQFLNRKILLNQNQLQQKILNQFQNHQFPNFLTLASDSFINQIIKQQPKTHKKQTDFTIKENKSNAIFKKGKSSTQKYKCIYFDKCKQTQNFLNLEKFCPKCFALHLIKKIQNPHERDKRQQKFQSYEIPKETSQKKFISPNKQQKF